MVNKLFGELETVHKMITAKMKCSNCGAEMSNMNFSWDKKYWLMMLPIIPILLLGFYPIAKMTLFKGDASKELSVSDIQKSSNAQNIDVVGLITNNGSHKWTNITIEAEFFDGSGAFLDEQSTSLRTEVPAGAKEHFKISFRTAETKLMAEDTKMVVKIAGGHTSPF